MAEKKNPPDQLGRSDSNPSVGGACGAYLVMVMVASHSDFYLRGYLV